MKITSMLLGVAVLIGATAVGNAQVPPYQTPYPSYYQPPPYPPSWSYDPYTSGIGACVQMNRGNSPPCKYTIEPTYGQPNYWPYRGG